MARQSAGACGLRPRRDGAHKAVRGTRPARQRCLPRPSRCPGTSTPAGQHHRGAVGRLPGAEEPQQPRVAAASPTATAGIDPGHQAAGALLVPRDAMLARSQRQDLVPPEVVAPGRCGWSAGDGGLVGEDFCAVTLFAVVGRDAHGQVVAVGRHLERVPGGDVPAGGMNTPPISTSSSFPPERVSEPVPPIRTSRPSLPTRRPPNLPLAPPTRPPSVSRASASPSPCPLAGRKSPARRPAALASGSGLIPSRPR